MRLDLEKAIELNRKLIEVKIFQVKINTLLEFRINLRRMVIVP